MKKTSDTVAGTNSILAIVEPDVHPQEVIERAALLARCAKCDLELLLCDSDIGPLGAGWGIFGPAKELSEQIVAAETAILDDLAADLRGSELQVEASVLLDRPIGDAILERVFENPPRFLVKGTKYHSASERSIFVHTDWQLVRSCPCPLYLVKPEPIGEKPTIVAAVDPMHSHDKTAVLDHKIVDFAQRLAEETDGDVELLHTYQELVGIGSEATRTFKPIRLPVEEIAEKMKVEHRKKLDALARNCGIESDKFHQLPGHARELIPMFARTHGADVVVMGAIARWSMKRAVLGSMAERVIDHLPCDILIVKADNAWDGD